MNGRARLPRTTLGLHLLIAVALGAIGISLSPMRDAVVGAAAPPRGTWAAGSSAVGGTVLSDGTDGTPQYSYNVNSGGGGVSQQTFTFQSTSAGSGTISVPYAYTGFHAYFAVTVQLTAFVTHSGTTVVDLVHDGPVNCCTAPAAGFTYTGTHDFVVASGDTYGFTFGGSNFDSNSILSGSLTLWPQTYTAAAAATIAQNTSWPNAAVLDGSTTGALLAPGEARWYKFPVTPSSAVQVDLSGLAQNYDLTMYTDIAQAFTTLTSTADLTKVTAQATGNTYSPSIYSPSIYSPSIYSPSIYSPSIYSPSIYSPSIYSPSIYSPSIYSPSIYSPSIYSPSIYSPSIYSPSIYSASGTFTQAFSSAQSQSLITISANDGTSPESIKAATWNNTGNFYVRVLGRNGASSSTLFTIGLTRSGGPCDNVPLDSRSTDATLAPTPGSFKTVIVTDTSRFAPSPERDDMKGKLTSLANATNGVVVDVKDSAKVQALQQQADNDRACPYAKNLVAQAIRDIVNSYRGTLQYVVLAGSDNVIPFFRYADGAGIGEEKAFNAPVDAPTAAYASLQNNLVFGQDAYGSLTDLTMKGGVLPVPDLAVGRLVETPAEISALIDNYITTPVLPSASSLSTGYSFLTSAADAISASFTAGGAAADTLITDQGVKTTDTTQNAPTRDRSWTATDLKNALFNSRHDLVFLGGHFNAQGALAADNSTSVYTTELESHPLQLQNSLVISVGCHSGFNLQDSDSSAGGTQLDWPEEMALQHATFIGGTGYQYEDTDFLAYSAKLYAGLAHQLLTGTAGTPIAVGQALVKAKLDYLSGLGAITGIDQKALIESTMYGLPMVGVDMRLGRLGAPATYTAPITPTPAATGTPGALLGLKSYSFEQAPNLVLAAKPVLDLNGIPTGVSAQWKVGPDGVQTGPALPALPQQYTDVTSSTGEVLRGVGFRSGTYSDQAGVLPLTGAPTTEQNNLHTSFGSAAFFPQRLATVNYFDDLATTGSGGTTRLITTAAQYRSDGPTTETDTERTYSHLGLSLFYSKNTQTYGQNTPALSAPPSISAVTGTPSPAGIAISAHVTGDPSAGIQQVWVTYTGEAGTFQGTWDSLDLQQGSNDSTLWTGTIRLPAGQSAAAVRFIIQAVNGVGLVGADNNLGDGYTPTLPNVATALLLTAPQAAQNTSVVSATLTRNDTGAPIAGQVVTFSFARLGGGGTSASGTTGTDGIAQVGANVFDGTYTVTAAFAQTPNFAPASATARTVVIDTTPPTITAAAVPPSPTGSNGWYTTSPVTVHFTCSDPGGSGIAAGACPSDQVLGAQGSVSSTSKTVTDIAGNKSAASNTVTVNVDSVAPTMAAAAGSSPTGLNGWYNTSPVAVLFTCTDPSGGSGIAAGACPLNQALSGQGSISSTSQTVTDIAGNKSAASNTVTVNVDSVAPKIAGTVPSPTGLTGWYTAPVTVSFTCTDTGSGIAPGACPSNQPIGAQGTSSVSQAVTDRAGNTATSDVVTVKVDSIAPTINSITPNVFILHGPTAVLPNATDDGSGLAFVRCDALSTATVGTQTVRCTAIDIAGNATTKEMPYQVIYRVDGFSQPINDPNICGATCAMSVFKGGSTVPVKFQLKDANGVVVQSTTTPAWYTPTKGVSSTLPISESTYSDTPTTGITYRWDGSAQYIYNWGTKGLATNAYWTIGVTLDDGTSHLVVVNLR